MMAIIYCRVSSENQKENLSLQVQEEACKNYCLKKDWIVHYIVTEIASASKSGKQVQLESLLDVTPNQPATLLVYNVSRFSRNVSQGLQYADAFYQNGIVLESTMEDINFRNPSGRFNFIQLLNNAELESKMLARRVSDALRQKRLEGNRLGKVPFGFKIDVNEKRTFVPHEAEHKVVQVILAFRTPGTSLVQINQLLQQLHQGPEEFVHLELYNRYGEVDNSMVIVDGLDFDNIADILNDYQLSHRGKSWKAEAVRNVWLRNRNK